MKNFISKSLTRKLAASFVPVAMAPLFIIGYLSFSHTKSGLEKAAFVKLSSATDLRKKEIRNMLFENMHDLRFMAAASIVETGVDTLMEHYRYSKPAAGGALDTSSPIYQRIVSTFHPFFEAFMDRHDPTISGIHDLLLVSAQGGHVIYSVQKLQDLGADIQAGPLKESGLAKVWARAVKSGIPATVDFSLYELTGGSAAFMGVPVIDRDGRPLAVLVARMGRESILEILKGGRTGDETAQVYLVGQDMKIRVDSGKRLEGPSEELIQTEATSDAFQNISDVRLMTNHAGQSVLAAYGPVGLRGAKDLGADFEWAVLTEELCDSAFASVHHLQTRLLVTAVFAAIAVAAISVLVARTISKPVTALASQVLQVSQGDLAATVEKSALRDEVGALTNGFRVMVENLRNQTREILEGVNVLAASASEISVTVAQLAATASRTASAVVETTTTVEEVKQAARVSADKAKRVAAEGSQKMLEVSTSGAQATEATIEKIGAIKGQMNSIGATVVSLSEKSQAIEEIISTVKDLADQSNLLAVNAAIEASRAGEHGRGFSVVAQEIKILSDQSRDAAIQVKDILDDIRKSVNAVVMVTEQGGRSVDAGVTQSALAADSIKALAANLSQASQAASVIAASSEQQFVGIDQVSSAMVSIEQAMKQNLDGAKQLESEAKRLEELGLRLKELVDRYKV